MRPLNHSEINRQYIFLDKKKNIHTLALNYIVILCLGHFLLAQLDGGKGGVGGVIVSNLGQYSCSLRMY